MNHYYRYLPAGLLFTVFLVFTSCMQEGSDGDTLFSFIPAAQSGIDFENTLTETDSFNYFLFSYIYMGGGVTAGDFNADGLTDIYLTANMENNHLYLNRGGLEFEEVGEQSGTAAEGRWMLGSTLCDINNDGLHDIYVCVSGLVGNRDNLLFINQGMNEDGIPVFTEEAHKYGIADPGLSTQAVFFDYDRDGDLDLYVANYPITHFKAPPFYYRQMMRNIRWSDSDHLYSNNSDGTFTDVTEEAGLLSFGLTLSATVSDLNLDGYKDIYISNDFTSPDYFFINKGDGTFSERCGEVAGQTSFYGMGADIADYNNDGYPDIMQIDMAPEDNKRSKENMTRMSVTAFDEMLEEGLHHQYRYSTLFLNRGVFADSLPFFSNAAWIAGVTSTDWSWAALFADFDLDGWKDLYITNGSRRDINNIDYFNKMQSSIYFGGGLEKSEFLEQIQNMPQKALANYMYRNNGDLSFSRCDSKWGMTKESFSNGVAYADLDNDGDLELVVNNIDQKAHLYSNNARELERGNFLKVDFRGSAQNRMGIGSVVQLWHDHQMQVAELTLSRGYQSSVEPILYFGLADSPLIDSLKVIWNDGRVQILKGLPVNQKLCLDHSDSKPGGGSSPDEEKLFQEITDDAGIRFVHEENEYNDFEKQVLLPHRMSRLGPSVSVGDVNNDGLSDFFAGNASGSTGTLFIRNKDGSFRAQDGPWDEDVVQEDAGSLLFDADGDGDLDLYIVSGGNEFPEDSHEYRDRFYLNEGQGIFIRKDQAIPDFCSSGSCVESLDMDNDGDLDLFVGGRQVPGKYPYPANSYILENLSSDEKVRFVDVTGEMAPSLKDAGLVCDVFIEDIDNNGYADIILAGEWMPISCYMNQGGTFKKTEVEGSRGWWFSLEAADFDSDGDMDLVAGNLGLNARYRTDPENYLEVYADDFDSNGSYDIIMSYTQENKLYPHRSRDCFVAQNPGLEFRFPSNASFGEATVEDIYAKKVLKQSLHLQSDNFASSYLENQGDGTFELQSFPGEAQLSPLNDMIIEDFDGDGHLDILAAGNMHSVEVVTPRFDGGVGIYLKGNGCGEFEALPARETGFFAPGDVKSLSLLKTDLNSGVILVGNNNDMLQVFEWSNQQ